MHFRIDDLRRRQGSGNSRPTHSHPSGITELPRIVVGTHSLAYAPLILHETERQIRPVVHSRHSPRSCDRCPVLVAECCTCRERLYRRIDHCLSVCPHSCCADNPWNCHGPVGEIRDVYQEYRCASRTQECQHGGLRQDRNTYIIPSRRCLSW